MLKRKPLSRRQLETLVKENQQAIRGLEDREGALPDRRLALALDAQCGDSEASGELRQVEVEALEISQGKQRLSAAIAGAEQQLATLDQQARRNETAARHKEVLALSSEATEVSRKLDATVVDMVDLMTRLDAIRDQQKRSGVTIKARTQMGESLTLGAFRRLGASDRLGLPRPPFGRPVGDYRTFTEWCQHVNAIIEGACAAELAETTGTQDRAAA